MTEHSTHDDTVAALDLIPGTTDPKIESCHNVPGSEGNHPLPVAVDEPAKNRERLPVDPWSHFKMPEGYSMSRKGAFNEKTKPDGEVILIPVSTGPVWLSERRVDLLTGETDLKICWYDPTSDNELSRWISRGQLYKRSTLLEMAELVSFPIYDGLAGETVKFLARMEQENQLPTTQIARKPGWAKNTAGETVFITGQGNSGILFHPDQDYRTYARALSSSGRFDIWLQAIRPIVTEFPIVLFALLAVLAAPLLRLFNASNFVVDFWGRTSCGKTSLLQILASVWGKPSGSCKLLLSWNNTPIFSERLAAFFGGGWPIFFDDSQTAHPKVVEAITYMIGNATGRGRAKPYSLKEVEIFQVILFVTGEKPITERSFPGAAARVIEINGTPFPNIEPKVLHQIKKIVCENYGFLGPRFVKELSVFPDEEYRENFENLREHYSSLAKNEIGQRFSEYFASIHAAGLITANAIPEMGWIDPLIVSAN